MSWTVPGMRDECYTSTFTAGHPPEMLTAHPHHSWCCGYVLVCSPTLTNRLNATVFSFAPDTIFSAKSTAKKSVGLVPDFWHRFLYNGGTNRHQVPGSFPLPLPHHPFGYRPLLKVSVRDKFDSRISSASAVASRLSSC